MKIAFFANSIVPVHANILKQRPVGGTETALVRLAAALHQRGHLVYVYTPLPNPPLSKPLFLPNRSISDLKTCDIFVAIREWDALFFGVNAKRKFFWSGDDVNLLQTIGVGDKRVMRQIDGILCASNWHAERMAKASGFDKNKAHGLQHAVQRELFSGCEPRSRLRLVYSSTPYRGLEHLVKIFPRIRQQFSTAELHICSGLTVYKDAPGIDDKLQQECNRILDLFKNIEGCVLHGNLRQSELARHLMRSSIMVYPNTFTETGCITALEAQAAGCAIVSTNLGALPETVGKAGILIDGDPASEIYQDKFVATVCDLLRDNSKLKQLSEYGLAQTRDWSDVAAEFEKIVAG